MPEKILCSNCKYDKCEGLVCTTCYQNGEAMNYTPVKEDQTAKNDQGKLKLTYVPTEIIRAIAKIRMFGVEKYKNPDNWKRVEKQRYKEAAYRHFLEYLDNPSAVDDESGLPALYHLACNIAFLIELEKKDGTFKS